MTVRLVAIPAGLAGLGGLGFERVTGVAAGGGIGGVGRLCCLSRCYGFGRGVFGGFVGGDLVFEGFGQDGGLIGTQLGVQRGHAIAALGDAHASVAAGVGFAFADRGPVPAGDDLVDPAADGFAGGSLTGFDRVEIVVDHLLLYPQHELVIHGAHLLGQYFRRGQVHPPVQHGLEDGRVPEMQVRGQRQHRLGDIVGDREHRDQMRARHHVRIDHRMTRTIGILDALRQGQAVEHHLMRRHQPLTHRTIFRLPRHPRRTRRPRHRTNTPRTRPRRRRIRIRARTGIRAVRRLGSGSGSGSGVSR